MKILFVIDRINSNSDANINLIKSITEVLNQENEIYFLGHDIDKSKCVNNEFCFYYKLDEDVRRLYFSLKSLSLIKKIIQLIKHPILSFFAIFKIFNVDLIALKYKKNIEKIAKKYNIDAVVSVSAPFYTAKALASANIDAIKIIYTLDPYADHHIYKSKKTLIVEKIVVSKVDKIITTMLLKETFEKRYENKSIALEFPALEFNDKIQETNPFDLSKINLVYIGSLYADIRSPEFIYNLIDKLNKNIQLTIVGGIYGEFSKEFQVKYEDVINKNVRLVGKIPKEETLKYLQHADVLINIGNKIDNMLPSKVLEIIATGKPVLNILQIENCPSIKYFDLYANALNLFAYKEIDFETLESVNDFIQNKKSISKKEIREKFFDATPEYVACKILDTIKNARRK